MSLLAAFGPTVGLVEPLRSAPRFPRPRHLNLAPTVGLSDVLPARLPVVWRLPTSLGPAVVAGKRRPPIGASAASPCRTQVTPVAGWRHDPAKAARWVAVWSCRSQPLSQRSRFPTADARNYVRDAAKRAGARVSSRPKAGQQGARGPELRVLEDSNTGSHEQPPRTLRAGRRPRDLVRGAPLTDRNAHRRFRSEGASWRSARESRSLGQIRDRDSGTRRRLAIQSAGCVARCAACSRTACTLRGLLARALPANRLAGRVTCSMIVTGDLE